MRRTIIALIGALLLVCGVGLAQELSGAGILPSNADGDESWCRLYIQMQ